MVKNILLILILSYCGISASYAQDINLYIFTSKTCGPCDKLKEFILQDNDIGKKLNVSFIDIDDYPDIAKFHRIKLVPTSIVLIEEKEIGRLIGYAHNYKNKLNKIINIDND